MARTSSSSSPVTVPLYPTFVRGTGWKVGIRVGFESDPGAWKLFEFDTGGPGFWAGHSPQWWTSFQPIPPGTLTEIKYASGNEYHGVIGNTTVYFAGAGDTLAASTPAMVAQIRKGKVKGKSWDARMAGSTPPLYKHFYGDFGADMKFYQPQGDYKVKLESVLLQMQNGFIVEIGPHPAKASDGVAGSLQIGLTPADIRSAGNRLALFPSPKGPMAHGVLRINGRTINVPLPDGSGAAPGGVLFDSGAPSTHIWTGTAIPQEALEELAGQKLGGTEGGGKTANGKKHKGTLPKGLELELVSGDVTILSFRTGTTTGKNKVSFSPAKKNKSNVQADAGDPDPPGYVNTGLVPFFNNRILFYPDGGKGFISLGRQGGAG